jgi:protein associated with RNAse G/E
MVTIAFKTGTVEVINRAIEENIIRVLKNHGFCLIVCTISEAITDEQLLWWIMEFDLEIKLDEFRIKLEVI